MMSESSNRFNSYLTSNVNASAPSGTVVIPAGTIFRGQVSYRNVIGSVYSVVELRDSTGAAVAVLGSQIAVGTGGFATFTTRVELYAGTYTWVTVNSNANNTYVAITGVCYKV